MAWIGLTLILIYYCIVSFFLRWKPQKTISVAEYGPPAKTSPALAAFLFESGRCERAFAAALVSLASKSYLNILQQTDWFVLERLRKADASLPAEEAAILGSLFSDVLHRYKFNAADCSGLCETYSRFEGVVKNIAEPELISPHLGIWLVGLIPSLIIGGRALASLPIIENGRSLISIAYFSIWIFVGCACLIAALRVWPATLRKLASFLPWRNLPIRPLNLNDAIPIYLTFSALMGFMFLAVLTSTGFAVLLISIVLLNSVFRHFLETPTRAGQRIVVELTEFREFLSRTDSDRLNRENQPGQTPRVLEKYTAYAVALDVEHAWGEEFTQNLLEVLQIDRAYGWRPQKLLAAQDGEETIELNIASRKQTPLD